MTSAVTVSIVCVTVCEGGRPAGHRHDAAGDAAPQEVLQEGASAGRLRQAQKGGVTEA